MKENDLLVITNKVDSHADGVISYMNSIGYGRRVVRLNTEEFGSNCITILSGDEESVRVIDSDRKIDLSAVSSVWFRRPEMPKVEHSGSEYDDEFAVGQINALLRSFYFLTHGNALWINPLPSLHKARNKLQQLQLAKQIGFRMPAWLATNDQASARRFFQSQKRVCVKSLDRSSFNRGEREHAIFTAILDDLDEFESQLPRLKVAPIYLQEFIQKAYDIRVVVFGSEVHAFRIYSQDNALSKTDFRGVAPHLLRHEYMRLPAQLEMKISNFMVSQGLTCASLDFVEDEDGEIFFIECNPNGQWMWLEKVTDIELTKPFVRYFSREAAHG